MKLKKGDKVLCKKSLLTSTYWKSLTDNAFDEGELYVIELVELAVDENYKPLGDNSYDIAVMSIYDKIGYNFNTKGNDNSWIFSEYFYIEKDVRKLKLDKINECW